MKGRANEFIREAQPRRLRNAGTNAGRHLWQHLNDAQRTRFPECAGSVVLRFRNNDALSKASLKRSGRACPRDQHHPSPKPPLEGED